MFIFDPMTSDFKKLNHFTLSIYKLILFAFPSIFHFDKKGIAKMLHIQWCHLPMTPILENSLKNTPLSKDTYLLAKEHNPQEIFWIVPWFVGFLYNFLHMLMHSHLISHNSLEKACFKEEQFKDNNCDVFGIYKYLV